MKLKNVGSKATNPDFTTILSFSWSPSISMKFNLPSKGHHLGINEEIIWKFKLDEDVPSGSTVRVFVRDEFSYFLSRGVRTWELIEQL
ncbi:MAG: hypothetical protein WC568_01610 [Candidatus Methanoperedens sp.]